MARKKEKKGFFVDIGGVPVDLHAGMIEAVTNPPAGFVSKHKFVETDVAGRVQAIDWFAQCGNSLSLDLSMEPHQVKSWPQAVASCKKTVWENAELEAQNQLTLWLSLHDLANYQKWNDYVGSNKKAANLALIIAAGLTEPGEQEAAADGPPPAESPIWPWPEDSCARRIEEARRLLGAPGRGMDDYCNRLAKTKDRYPFGTWAKWGIEQHTDRALALFAGVFNHLIERLTTLREQASEQEKIAAIRHAVEALNALNEKNEVLIETDEREDLCKLFEIIAATAGLDPQKYARGDGPASEWREW